MMSWVSSCFMVSRATPTTISSAVPPRYIWFCGMFVNLAAPRGIVPENVNFAIKASVARAFMDANGVPYRVAASERQMSTAEIGDQARKFTSFVTCTL